MKNFKEQLKKIKFLIPLSIGATIILFVSNSHKAVSVRDKIEICVGILFLTIMVSAHYLRMVFDRKYNHKYTKYINKEKQKPWYMQDRYSGGGAAPPLDITLIFIYTVIPILILVHFISIGRSTGIWYFPGIVLPVLFLLIVAFACKNTYKKNSKK